MEKNGIPTPTTIEKTADVKQEKGQKVKEGSDQFKVTETDKIFGEVVKHQKSTKGN
mgnify:CR=1 FL=1